MDCHNKLKGNRCTKIVYSKYGYSVETNWIAMSEGGHIWSKSPTFQFPIFYCDNKSDYTVLQKYWPVLSKCVRCYKRSWPSGPVWTGRSTSLVAARRRLDRKVNFSCSNSRIWRGPACIFGGPDSHFLITVKHRKLKSWRSDMTPFRHSYSICFDRIPIFTIHYFCVIVPL